MVWLWWPHDRSADLIEVGACRGHNTVRWLILFVGLRSPLLSTRMTSRWPSFPTFVCVVAPLNLSPLIGQSTQVKGLVVGHQ